MKKSNKNKGYFIIEMLICIFLFSIFIFIMSIFLRRTAVIEKLKVKEQKEEENVYFVMEKIKNEIYDRERKNFEFEGKEDNIHISSNMLIFKKKGLFYKIEFGNKKLYISEGKDTLNFGSKSKIAEYEKLEFLRENRILLIIIKLNLNEAEKVKIINLM